MKSPYDETYLVDTIIYGIAKTDTGFSVWKADCMVGEFPDVAKARKEIHDRARLHCVEELNAVEKRAEEVKQLFQKLSDNLFRLDGHLVRRNPSNQI